MVQRLRLQVVSVSSANAGKSKTLKQHKTVKVWQFALIHGSFIMSYVCFLDKHVLSYSKGVFKQFLVFLGTGQHFYSQEIFHGTKLP